MIIGAYPGAVTVPPDTMLTGADAAEEDVADSVLEV
jgi:hypothetical protein